MDSIPMLYPDSAFFPLLFVWLLFPLHAPVTLLVLDAPFGRFAWTSMLNLPGNFGWFIMEIVAPVTFILNLPVGHMSSEAKILAGLYLMHYAHRAIISPLVLAPRRSSIHIMVVACAVIFNLMNATLLARGLAYFPPRTGVLFYVGVALWIGGFIGNVYHDEILHDLRRRPSEVLVSAPSSDPVDKHPNGRYTLPRGGLFAYVSFPNYFCEWIEWTGFALAAAPSLFIPINTGAFAQLDALLPFDLSAHLPARLLSPPWAFVLAEVTSMLPRAIRGHRWYKDSFPGYPKERKAVVPGLI